MGFFDKPEVISPGGDGAASGVDQGRLLELEQRVARLEMQLAALTRGAQQPDAEGSYAAPPVQDAWMAEVQALRSSGKLIHAIKLYRERTGVGLKEAKDAVEALPG